MPPAASVGGTEMDKYEMLRKLGQGTYGTVFLCRHRSSGRQCVMKRLQLNSLNERERRAALQEASLAVVVLETRRSPPEEL